MEELKPLLLVFIHIAIWLKVVLFFVIPLVCEYRIVPGIEKKIGKKLGYSPRNFFQQSMDVIYSVCGVILYIVTDWWTLVTGFRSVEADRLWRWNRPEELTGIIMDVYHPNQKKQYQRWYSYFKYSPSVVEESGYTREMVSRGELIFCFFSRLNSCLTFLMLIFIAAAWYPGW